MGRLVVSGAKGFHGRVIFNNQELCVEEWNVNVTAEEEDITNSCSKGFMEREYGVVSAEGTINAVWDAQLNIFSANPPKIQAGLILSATLYIHSSDDLLPDGPYFNFPKIGVRGVELTVPAKGKVIYVISFANVGTFDYPSGDVSSSVSG